jgi:hypothetical protein
MVKTRGDHRGVAGTRALSRHPQNHKPLLLLGVEVDEAFEFDTIWAPLGGDDDAAAMDDDEWFQQAHDGHEKVNLNPGLFFLAPAFSVVTSCAGVE